MMPTFGLASVGRNVNLLTVHERVAVADHLMGSGAGVCVVQAVNNVDELSLATRPADQTAHLLGAFLPSTYMESPRARMAAYAELAKTTSTDEVDELALRWKDRFGPLPRPANSLLAVHKIKILASRRRIASVEFLGQKLLLSRNGNYITFNNHFPHLSATKSTDKLKETIRFLETF